MPEMDVEAANRESLDRLLKNHLNKWLRLHAPSPVFQIFRIIHFRSDNGSLATVGNL